MNPTRLTADEAIDLIQNLLERDERKPLNALQEHVFRGAWLRKEFREIGKAEGVSESQIKNIGSQVWKLLSEVLGVKVTKPHLREVLELWATQHPEALQAKQIRGSTGSTIQSHLQALPVSGSDSTIPEESGLLPPVLGDYLPLPPQVFGRGEDLGKLEKAFQPSVAGEKRCVFLTGALGVGKTTVAANFAATTTGFDRVIWLSLIDCPPLNTLLKEILQHTGVETETDDRQVLSDHLRNTFRSSRCLLFLDGAEQILNERPEYQAFIRQIVEERHRSCTVLVSDQDSPTLRRWRLAGLSIQQIEIAPLNDTGRRKLLEVGGIVDAAEQNSLISLCGGNPLLLKTAVSTITTLFGGNVSEYVNLMSTVFTSDIQDLMSPQFDNLDAIEKEILICLSRSSATPTELKEQLQNSSASELVNALEVLQRSYLIEVGQAVREHGRQTSYSLTPTIRKYVVKVLLPEKEKHS